LLALDEGSIETLLVAKVLVLVCSVSVTFRAGML
jgi:hypothetical protein